MKTWSTELIEKTRRELQDMLTYTDPSGKLHWLIGSIILDNGVHFKNIDGERFGIMFVDDAYNGKYTISLKNDAGQEIYETIDTLIDAGWALD